MELSDITTMLARTPLAIEKLVDGLPSPWLHHHDGAGTWSAYDIVGHLAHGDRTNWVPRAVMIIDSGTGRPFEPFDREAMLTQARQPIESLVHSFRQIRERSLAELEALKLQGSDLDRRGLHPSLGEVKLGQLLAAWVAHDLTHLSQIGEVLARFYRDEVGPWRAFMPALDRIAHAE